MNNFKNYLEVTRPADFKFDEKRWNHVERISKNYLAIQKQPAKIYDLLMLESLVTRLNTNNPDKKTVSDIKVLLKLVLENFAQDKPDLLVTNQDTIKISLENIERVLARLDDTVLGESMVIKIKNTLIEFKTRLSSLDSNSTSPNLNLQISELFQVENFFEYGEKCLNKMISDYKDIQPPKDIYPELKEKVSFEQAKLLINYFQKQMFGSELSLDMHQSDYRKTKLLWSLKNKQIDYFLVDEFTITDFLRMEVPHNVVHFQHLQQLLLQGVGGYFDEIYKRGYFESVSVFSEYWFSEELKKSSKFSDEIHNILKFTDISKEDFRAWLISIRDYELKLRAIRLFGELKSIQGKTLEEIKKSGQELFSVSKAVIEKEVAGFLPFTGLTAIYGIGYQKLLGLGIKNPSEAIFQNDRLITNWEDLEYNLTR